MGFMAREAPRGAGSRSFLGPYGRSDPRRGLGKGALRLSAWEALQNFAGGPGARFRGAAPIEWEGGGRARSQPAGRSKFGAHQASSYSASALPWSERWAH